MFSKQKLVLLTHVALVFAACSEPLPNTALASAGSKHGVEYIDSVVSPEESAARFRNSLGSGPTVTRLDGGATSRDDLILKFTAALEQLDTAALRNLALTPREFVDVYYPESEYTRPPYQLGADIVWIMMSEQSEKGLRRLLQRVGGQPAAFRSYGCPDAVIVQGSNRIINGCTVARGGSASPTARLFSGIIEHGGHFKFVSYANDM